MITLNKKGRLAIVFTMLVALSLALSLSASATSVDPSDGWFRLDLTNAEYTTGVNESGTPYLRFSNVFTPHIVSPASTTEMIEVVLMSKYSEYNTNNGSGQPLYYTYAPVTVANYMSLPAYDSGTPIVRFPSAIVLPTDDAKTAGVQSPWFDYNFEFYGVSLHCRFAICLSNGGRDLIMLYNPAFYSTAEAFLGAYNNQTDFGKYQDTDTGIILLHTNNPALGSNIGYQEGYTAGYTIGYNNGFDIGADSTNTPIGILFSGVNSVLSIKLFGDVTLGLLVYSALGLGALFVVMKMFGK